MADETNIDVITAEIKTAVGEIKAAQADGATKSELAEKTVQLDEMKARLDAMETKMNRPATSIDEKAGVENVEYKAAFDKYLRSGDDRELKTISEMNTTNANGGYTITPTMAKEIVVNIHTTNPVRKYANVLQVGNGVLAVPFAGNGLTAGIIGEAATHTATTADDISLITIATKDFYVNFPVSNKLLADSSIDIAAYIAKEAGRAIGSVEGVQFITGNGLTINCQGICVTGNGITPVDTIAASGVIAETDLFALYYSLKQEYRANAVWMASPILLAAIMKLKDGTGAYLWQRSMAEGQPDTLLGRPVIECESMASTYTNDNYLVAFGDLSSGYQIIDNAGINILVNPYAAMGFTSFQVTKYTGAAVLKPEAIKILSASAGA